MIHIASDSANSSLSVIHSKDIQPNAVDVRVDKVFRIEPKEFKISESEKKHRGSVEILPDEQGYFNLVQGAYEIIMEGIVSIGEGEAGWIITRSTLNRNGLYITSGLYDSGYEGVMAGALHVSGGPAKIQQGTRVGQFLLFPSESLSSYDGDYGIGKSHDEKYGVN